MIEILISKEKSEARISIQASDRMFPSEAEIKKAIADAGVVNGLDEAVLQQILQERKSVQRVVFASSDTAASVPAGYLNWHIDIKKSIQATFKDSERVDFKQLNLFQRVKKDQLLVSSMINPFGEMKTVTGDPIKREVQQLESMAGKNTRLSTDGSKMYAGTDGVVFWKEDKLCVDNVYHIKGDVNYSTGHIKFPGNLVIEGDVRAGFRVEAGGSIQIGGNVEATTIFAQDGDIFIQYGILGQGRARVLCGGDLKCGFIQDARVSVRGNVIIEHYSMNSRIAAGGEIRLMGHEGLIRGGQLTAQKGITAIDVGSPNRIQTELNIVVNGLYGDDPDMWKLCREKSLLHRKMDLMDKRVRFIELLMKDVDHISIQKQEELTMLRKSLEVLRKRWVDIEQRGQELVEKLAKEASQREIRVLRHLHSNVKVGINLLTFHNKTSQKNVRIFRNEDEIVVVPVETEAS